MTEDLPIWFPAQDINFSRIQLETFLLPELNNLRAGYYPSEPDEYITYVKGARVETKRSGYERSGKKSTNHQANFIAAAEIAAEIDARLSKISLGWWVQSYYTDGFTFEEIAKFNHTTEEWVKRGVGLMVNYIKGWPRKRIKYETWLKLKKVAIPASTCQALDKAKMEV